MRDNKIKFGISVTILLTAVWLISGCTKEVHKSGISKYNGRVFLAGDERPFSGVVTGEAREGYRRVRCAYKKQYVDGLLHGKSYYYHPNGKPESIEPYKNGKLHGIVSRYHENGRIKAKIHFVGGMRGGLHGEVFWDKEGRILG